MALKTTLEQLEAVQSAIEDAEKMLSSGKSDKTLTRQRISDLYAREERLLLRYQEETGSGGIAINIGIPGRKY